MIPHNLLLSVLGPDGHQAIERSVSRTPHLAASLAPRTALAWARLACGYGYDGVVPGRPGTRLLVKSQRWALDVGDEVPPVAGRGEAGLAALLLVLSGVTEIPPGTTPDAGLVRLGKSLDVMADANWRRGTRVEALRKRAIAATRRALEKAQRKGGARGASGAPSEGPGTAKIAGPAHQATGAVAATPPMGAQPKVVPQAQAKGGASGASVPKPNAPGAAAAGPKMAALSTSAPKQKKMALARSELTRSCSLCGDPQMVGQAVPGCRCFAPLAKATRWEIQGDKVLAVFPTGDPDAVVTFLEAVRCGR